MLGTVSGRTQTAPGLRSAWSIPVLGLESWDLGVASLMWVVEPFFFLPTPRNQLIHISPSYTHQIIECFFILINATLAGAWIENKSLLQLYFVLLSKTEPLCCSLFEITNTERYEPSKLRTATDLVLVCKS